MEDHNKTWLEEKKVGLEQAKTTTTVKHGVEKKHDRTGNQGAPKKGGAGGKGVWGKGGMDDLRQVSEDPNDPNYDSDEATDEIILTPVNVSPVLTILREYYSSGEVEDAAKSLEELNAESLHKDFVKKALVLAIEKQAFERELTSRLLLSLYNKVIKAEKIEEGFKATLDSLSDIVLDNPDCVDTLGKFIARAIVDEVLAPAFLKHANTISPHSKECIALASALVTEPHRIDRLAHIWGPGDLSSVKRLKEEVNLLLNEYLSTSDKEEADKCVRKLNAPSFLFQLVNRALRLAIEKSQEERQKLSELLAYFFKEGLVSSDHMVKGFLSVQQALTDISLDVPTASAIFSQIVQDAKNKAYLPADYTA